MRNTKVSFIQGIFIFCFALILGRAFYIQILTSDKLISYFESQLLREMKIFPKRGSIYDRNGAPLAINVQTFSLFTFPKELKNKNKFIQKIKKILPDLNYSKISKDIKNRSRFTWVARNWKLTNKQKESLEAIEGLYLEPVYSRFYPNSYLGSQLLGFVGIDNAGLAGLEFFYNEKLKGKEQVIKYFKDAKGRPIRQKSEIAMTPAQDLQLSIDKNLQAASERFLQEAIDHHDADSGGIGVMDTKTGEVLVMANLPSFDANNPHKYPVKLKKLPYVTDPFEPGSVLKTFTVASAIEHGIVNLETNYYCENGTMLVDNHTISEADKDHHFEWLSVEGIMINSSNIGTTKIAFDLGFPKLMKSFEKFNLTSKTGIENSAESNGIFQDDKDFSRLRLSNISFGQGIATTGIQILAAYGAIVNDGVWVAPTFLKNQEVRSNRVISSQTAKLLKKTLIKVVDEGTGSNAAIEHFSVGGKTGTAQRISSSGGYDGYISSFAGFVDLGEKSVVIFTYLDNPKKNGFYGGSTSAPVFQKVAKTLIYKNKALASIANVSKTKNSRSIDKLNLKQSAPLKYEANTVPTFIGLDKMTAKKMARKYGLDLKIKGFGIVRSQYPLPGSPLKKSKKISLHFAKPTYD